jgi:hypothetical protein
LPPVGPAASLTDRVPADLVICAHRLGCGITGDRSWAPLMAAVMARCVASRRAVVRDDGSEHRKQGGTDYRVAVADLDSPGGRITRDLG